MKKIPAIILLVILTVFIVLFLFFPNILTTTKEIAGCMDRTSESFDPLANVHDSTMCSSNRKQPTKELEESVDSLRNSSWKKDKYDHIRSSILSYFSSEGKSGTDDEENSLHNLDAVYMSVLYVESKKSSKKCFSNYSNIKNEVDKFYKKYKIQIPFIKWNEQTFFRISAQVYNSKEDFIYLIESLREFKSI